MELTPDSSWRLLTVQDYRNQKTIVHNSPVNTQTTLNNQLKSKLEPLIQKATSEGLSHKEISEITFYAINTIRSKASKGEPITTKDGFIYRYDKDPHVLKWLRV